MPSGVVEEVVVKDVVVNDVEVVVDDVVCVVVGLLIFVFPYFFSDVKTYSLPSCELTITS